MSIKLAFEIGHSASHRTKPSKDGFTHDWELFVRGANEGSDIGHFVEKVVFNLHESFPKPKRVIKEPPYTVKEAGYAGFLLTIDIYLRNRDEPKKFTVEYDLDLQPFKKEVSEFTIDAPSDEFKRKCLKGGGVLLNSSNDFKGRDSYGKLPPMPAAVDMKKSSKRPEETKPNKTFTDVFGAPLKKPDPRALLNSSPNPTKLQSTSSSKGIEKNSTSSASGGKDKGDKSKHKHSPNKDGKDSKKPNDKVKPETEKVKKDKTKDRERAEKKEKTSKRPLSPSPASVAVSSSSARNSSNVLPVIKADTAKPQSKLSSTPVPVSDPSFNKKSSKKEKKSHDKERDRSEKKGSRSKESFSAKEKTGIDSTAPKAGSGGMKERDSNAGKDERDKAKTKSNVPASTDPKTMPMELVKKQHEKETERKHKHKKKEKTKDKDAPKESKKEKPSKNQTVVPPPAKAKEPMPVKYEPPTKSHLSDKGSSDSNVDSPPSIKQDSDNSISDPIVTKPPPEPEKAVRKPRERAKPAEKEDKGRKRKSNKKDDRQSASPPPSKQSRKESPAVHERPSSSDLTAHQSHTNNNNLEGATSDKKISNEYMTELKDLKHKITTLKNNDDLQQVVRLIAATGCYEITKSSFDFDLVQLDRGTVERLQEFFAAS